MGVQGGLGFYGRVLFSFLIRGDVSLKRSFESIFSVGASYSLIRFPIEHFFSLVFGFFIFTTLSVTLGEI
ncbi:MAG: hypothetical protein VR66_10360 [Peptococcaceae bacterium BRH_c23]|nr:MAG: hypothetical protein VR66_10360 [Peptococcaceae bacterium BRH_c23]KJS81495.1 MAG: hypothetical protein JL57_26320 [Desulfosporosinus sp. BICA1-9]HBW35231.1 hypothetical protein [Desulfosporosinus sp.]